jgi:DNA-directed RNA polymerase I, II, and III subunit RPABC3
MASGDATLFEESFTVMEYDQSKYDRVARISCTSADSQTIMSLDINIELFPCARGDSLHVVLTTTLALDGSKEEEKGWRDVGKGGDAPATIADLYDYVCHGKIYKFEETFDGNTMYVCDPKTEIPILCYRLNLLTGLTYSNAYVSFGGLLMSLQGPVKKLTPLRVDDVYLLVKK